MTIVGFQLYRYSLPLRRPLLVGDLELHEREGLVVVLVDENGYTGIGEIAPLPGYSPESLDEAADQTRTIRHRIYGSTVPVNLEELSGGFHRWLGKASGSVRFGIESAVLHLLAARTSSTLDRLLSDSPSESLAVNRLVDEAEADIASAAAKLRADFYTTVKLKVGRRALKQDIAAVTTLREIAGPDIAIRLDANRRFTIEQALQFLEATATCGIEYVEEPTGHGQLRRLASVCAKRGMRNSLALDESLALLSPENLADHPGIDAIVLKPSLLGLERSMQFARIAKGRGLKVVVGAMFETSVAVSHLARFGAAVMDSRTAAGLDTISWLDDDLLAPPVTVEGGQLHLGSLPSLEKDLEWGMLTEIAID